MAEISKHLDYVALMSYDFHGAWDDKTGFNAPLFHRKSESGAAKTLNVAWAVQEWLKRGCPRSKLVVGMATYGRSFTLKDSSETGVGAPATGPGRRGLYTGVEGFMSYYEICERVKNYGWAEVYDEEQKASYIHSDNQWVGFDSKESLIAKTEYLMSENLAGGMVWTYDLDDFEGRICGEGKYPLINAIKMVLERRPLPTTTTTTTTTTAATTTATAALTTTPSVTPISTQMTRTLRMTKPKMPSEYDKILVCYYTNWSQYRPGLGRFTPNDIDPFLCTHIHYAFAVIKNGTLQPFEWNDDDSPWGPKGNYKRVLDLRKVNPKLKVLLSVGGWNHGGRPFTDIVKDPVKQTKFVDQVGLRVNTVFRRSF